MPHPVVRPSDGSISQVVERVPRPDVVPPSTTPDPKVVVVSDTKDESSPSLTNLEVAATALLKSLDASVAQFVREIAYIHVRLPVWAILVGAVQRCYEEGTLASPPLTPTMRTMCNGWKSPWQIESSKCEQCGRAFMPLRWSQRFCDNDCGMKHATAVRLASVQPRG